MQNSGSSIELILHLTITMPKFLTVVGLNDSTAKTRFHVDPNKMFFL